MVQEKGAHVTMERVLKETGKFGKSKNEEHSSVWDVL